MDILLLSIKKFEWKYYIKKFKLYSMGSKKASITHYVLILESLYFGMIVFK